MATNAPYYQVRGQFTTGANTQFVPDVDDYDLSASVTPHDTALHTDRQPSETPTATLEDNHNFVELLEAATTAAGQASQPMQVDTEGQGMAMSNTGKRKRLSSPPVDESGNPTSRLQLGKRARSNVPTDPQLHSTEVDMRDRSQSSSVPPSGESLLNDARAAGVHSAAALFRRASEKTSRKYTRPPMSKLFMSLQLTPENFLHLQAQAKSYMLDPAYPDRQNCVGNRGKGDTDMVKLRLFECVSDFLHRGAGEQFFGERVEKPGQKDAIEAARALGEEQAPAEDKLVWPRDGNKIISLVTPLLRRMVTNERQRMYAIQTRKGGTKRKEASVEAADHSASDAARPTGQHNERRQTPPNSIYNNPLVPSQSQLQRSQSIPISSLPNHTSTQGQTMSEVHDDTELPQIEKLKLPDSPPADPFLDRINIFLTVKEPRGVKNDIKIEPERRITANPPSLPSLHHYTWDQLNQEIRILVAQAARRYKGLHDPLGMGPEALRGLAVAATEMQNTSASSTDVVDEHANGGETAQNDSASDSDAASTRGIAPPTEPFSPLSGDNRQNLTPVAMQTPSTVLPVKLLPQYKIKTMWTMGWKYLESGFDWHHVLLDVGYSVWADGCINVVVELETSG